MLGQFGHKLKLSTMAVVTLSLFGCAPQVARDDAGDRMFARNAMLTLLGRLPNGSEEAELLADIGDLYGRKWVVRALMEREEFVEHWTHLMMDYLKVQRGGRRDHPSSCFGAPAYENAQGDTISDHGVIAQTVRDNPPNIAAPGTSSVLSLGTAVTQQPGLIEFNMNDLIRSAIRLDDLSPTLSGFVFPFVRRGITSMGGQSGRMAQADIFTQTFLHRNFQCVTCHTASYSLSDRPGWKRTWPIPILTENAVFEPYWPNPVNTQLGASPIFRQDAAVEFGDDTDIPDTTLRPWGMSDDCGRYRVTLSDVPAIIPENGNTEVPAFFAGATGSRASAGDLVARYRSGYDKIKANGISTTPTSIDGLSNTNSDEALAFMVASSMAMFVWETVMGENLTIAHHYARTQDQMMMRWSLTTTFVSRGFSLKALLERIVLSEYFNRRAPMYSGEDTPYHIPLIFNPWIQREFCPKEEDLPTNASPSAFGMACKNGQGALVQRWPSRTLLSAAGYAMGWPQPRVFPANNSYPDRTLALSTGQYLNDLDTGSKSVIFQGLLGFESELGACEKKSNGSDWIDHLVSAAQSGGDNVRLDHVLVAIKDRILQHPALGEPPEPGDGGIENVQFPGGGLADSVAGTELQALADLFGLPLSTPADAVPELEANVRRYCGVLFKSPQFMLSGVAAPMPDNMPDLRVCLPDEPCSYFEMCRGYRNTLTRFGKYMMCHNGSVTEGTEDLPVASVESDDICPLGTCLYLTSQPLFNCLADPGTCQNAGVVPPCDPRGDPAATCGERPDGALGRGAFITLLEGAVVQRSDGVDILTPGTRRYRALRTGEPIMFGSVLRLQPGSELDARSGAVVVKTPEGGMPARTEMALRAIDRELLAAASRGSEVEISALLEAGANPDARDAQGESVLIKAVRSGNAAGLRQLLDTGADWSVRAFNGTGLADALNQMVNDPATDPQSVSEARETLRRNGIVFADPQPAAKDSSEYDTPAEQTPGDALTATLLVPPASEPWFIIVSGSSALVETTYGPIADRLRPLVSALAGPPEALQTQTETLSIWRDSPHSRGLAGPVLTAEEEEAMAREYLEKYAPLEHD